MGRYLDVKGRAAVFYEVGRPFEIKEYPVPAPEPGAIVVRITVANICGSDLHQWRGELELARYGTVLPTILGHEMTGRVLALGPGVTTDSDGVPLKEGDRIVYRHFYHCGRCRACLRRNYVACVAKSPHRKHSCDEWPHFNGAYAEYLYLRPNQVVFKTPDDLADDLVAGANCALSQVIQGLQKVGLRFGETVVIQGAGGLGIYATAVAREMGADRIIVIDGLAHRLDLARSFGADDVVDLREYDTPQARVARVRALTGGWGADVVVEVVGNPKVVREGIQMLGPGGRYLAIGNINVGWTTEIDPSELILGNKNWISSAFWDGENLKQALDFLLRTRERYPFDRVLSHKFPLDRINEAFTLASQNLVTRAAVLP